MSMMEMAMVVAAAMVMMMLLTKKNGMVPTARHTMKLTQKNEMLMMVMVLKHSYTMV